VFRSAATMAVMPGTGKRYVVLYGGEVTDDRSIQTYELTDDEIAVLDVDSGTWSRRVTVAQV
jgi:hypothetical protein